MDESGRATLSTGALTKLSTDLSAAFGRPLEVASVDPVSIGANAATHFVASCRDGSKYGLKLAERAGVTDGTARERIALELAELIGVPNASRARSIPSIAGLPGALAQRPFVAIEWLTGTVLQLRSAQAAISQHRIEFLQQYGRWSVFAAMIGAEDRNETNLLWDEAGHRLSHIDLEAAFNRFASPNHLHVLREQLSYARGYGGLDGARWQADPNDFLGSALEDGIRQGDADLRAKRDEILRFLRGNGIAQAILEGIERWIDVSADEKVRLAKTLVN